MDRNSDFRIPRFFTKKSDLNSILIGASWHSVLNKCFRCGTTKTAFFTVHHHLAYAHIQVQMFAKGSRLKNNAPVKTVPTLKYLLKTECQRGKGYSI